MGKSKRPFAGPPPCLGDSKRGVAPFGRGLGTAGPHVYPYSPPRRGGVGGGGLIRHPCLGDSKRGLAPFGRGVGNWLKCSGVVKGRCPFGRGLGTAGPQMYPYSPPRRGGVGGGGLIRHTCLGDSKRGIAPLARVWGPQVPKYHSFSPLPYGEGLGEGVEGRDGRSAIPLYL